MSIIPSSLHEGFEYILRGSHSFNDFLARHGGAPQAFYGPNKGEQVTLLHDVLSILKGARNGAVYGAKIRFPHALVMTYLFTTGTQKQKLTRVFRATQQHSRNLMKFVFIYKSLMVLLRRIRGRDAHEHSADAFVAGTVGGYIVFGENNNINNQIVLYLFSRILVGLAKTGAKHVQYTAPEHTFSVFAAVVWGVVMWLFRHERDSLQGSLQASMHYLYNLSETYSHVGDWLWHNVAISR